MKRSTSTRLTTRPTDRRAWLMRLLATPVLLIALAGCSTGAPDAAESSQGDGSGSSAGQPVTDAEFSAARDAYDLELAQCFRDKGLDVKDPLPGVGITESSPELQAAFPACAEEIGDPPTSGSITLTPDELTALLERAECLREMGYDIQEPTLNDPGFIPGEVTAEDFDTCQA